MILFAPVRRGACYNKLIQITLPARGNIGVQFESISVAQHQLAKVNHNKKGSIFVLKTVGNKEPLSTQVQHDIPHIFIKIVSLKNLIDVSCKFFLCSRLGFLNSGQSSTSEYFLTNVQGGSDPQGFQRTPTPL